MKLEQQVEQIIYNIISCGRPGYCPNCSASMSLMYTFGTLGSVSIIDCWKCPECGKQIMWLNELSDVTLDSGNLERKLVSTTLLFPKHPIKQIPQEIPEEFATDFREAHDTLDLSPKASAALSRRCLQTVIRQQEDIRRPSLRDEIQQLLAKNVLPRYLADDLDLFAT